jgi:AraC-like DNA-binding protein
VLEELSLYNSNFYTLKTDAKDVYKIEKIIKELSVKKPNYHIRSVQYFLDFLYSLSTRVNVVNQNVTDYDKITPAIDKIISNTEEYFTVNDLANLCDLSVSRFLFLFKKLMGKSPIAFKNEILLERAKNMLTDSDMTITEISLTLGEQDPLYLSKKFKKAYGTSPLNYRLLNKNTTKNDKV